MTTLFALFAEVERDLISERTREGLAKARASGRKLGRPKGLPGRLTGENLVIEGKVAGTIKLLQHCPDGGSNRQGQGGVGESRSWCSAR